MKFNRLYIVFALMAVLLVVAACGNDGAKDSGGNNQTNTPPSSQTPAPTPPPAPPANPDPVQLTIFSASGGNAEALDAQYLEAIRTKYPHMTLELIINAAGTRPAEIIAANTPIDLIFGSIGTFYSTTSDFNLHMDLDPLIKKHNYDLSKIEPSMIEFQRRLLDDGKVYGLPVWNATSGLFYNKDIFDKFGVDYPVDDMMWDDVVALASRMTRRDGDINYIGYVTSPGHQMLTNQLSMAAIDPATKKSTFTNEAWASFMSSIMKLYTEPGHQFTTEELAIATQRNLFEKDMRVAMYTNYSGGTPPETMNWDVVTVPYYKEAPGVGPQPYPNYWYVSSISKHPDESFKVIEFLTSEEFQIPHTRKGYATVLKDPTIKAQYGQDLPKFQGKNVTAMFPKVQATPPVNSPYQSVAQAQFQNVYTAIITGAKDLNTAMREAADAVNKHIEEAEAAKAAN